MTTVTAVESYTRCVTRYQHQQRITRLQQKTVVEKENKVKKGTKKGKNVRDIKVKNLRVRGGIIVTTHPNTRLATQGRKIKRSYTGKRRPEKLTCARESNDSVETHRNQLTYDQPSDVPQVFPLTPVIVEYVPLRQPKAALARALPNLSESATMCASAPPSTTTPPPLVITTMTPCASAPFPTTTPTPLVITTMTPEKQWEEAMKKLKENTKKEMDLDKVRDEREKPVSQQRDVASGREGEAVQQPDAVDEPLPMPAVVLPAVLPAAPAVALPVAPEAVIPAPAPADLARKTLLEEARAKQQVRIEREHLDLICFRCQERGHVQKYCTRNRVGRYCFRCSADGYDTMSCPYCAKYQKRAVENAPGDVVPSLLDLDFSHLTFIEDEEGRKRLVNKR
ncbi:hypothetical protein TKK_0009845 [Trichogramma kaykai]|uniref:CCHC-type domain-containing protein n=1 Tax=Trichogramma kaykai TaxID=54128 RepID=A0ABD2X0T1_9HYME